jgi:hypothetical protein
MQVAMDLLKTQSSVARREPIRRAALDDTLAICAEVLLPTIAKGVIMRRPRVLAIAEALDLDRRAIRRMRRVRDQHGEAPLLLGIPGRSLAMILSPEDVHRILSETPEPFSTATKEKRAALAHFEPKQALISEGAARADRRRFNEQVLDAHQPVHQLAEWFLCVVDEEVERMCAHLGEARELGWRQFSRAWFRIVRRVIFGEAAAVDFELSEMMARLRRFANWAFLAPRQTRLTEKLLDRIHFYIERAEPHTLAAVIARTYSTPITAPAQQVPQWLFAFDPAGMATFRALALLAAHRDYGRLVRTEMEGRRGRDRAHLPLTRAAVLESLRLWPTTPLILRESTHKTEWTSGTLPAGTEFIIYTPFFHRDNERLAFADRFTPELWMSGEQPSTAALVPFSEGPAFCPGQNLVLLLASATIAAILDTARVRLIRRERLNPERPLPATLNHFALCFELAP